VRLLLVLAMACTGKHAPPGDSEDAVIDVSDLECAGLEWSEDGVAMSVPTTTTDGCDGGRVLGVLTCMASGGFGSNDVVEVSAHGQRCFEVPVAEDGSFDTGVLAPYSDYSLQFDGYLANGDSGLWYYTLAVCSDDVEVAGAVDGDPVDSGS